MRIVALLLLLTLIVPAANAQILTTEVWVGDISRANGRLSITNLRNVSNHPGYDNQPAFFPDGESLLYSSEVGGLAETGLGIQPVRYFLATGESVPLTRARGFSPTPAPDGKAFMTLREGTVWLHALDGTPKKSLLPQVSTAGYFARIDEDRWVLFMNEKDRSIAIWDASRRTRSDVVHGAITAPYKAPWPNSVTFVVDDEDVKTIIRLDLHDDGGSAHRPIGTIPFPTGGNHVWTSHGTLLIASGNKIYEWNPDLPDLWPVLYEFSEPDLQGITRIALSPREDRIALVSTPKDVTLLRESRDAANRDLAEALAKSPGSAYVRTTETLDVSGSTATERGTWIRTWRGTSQKRALSGDYAVTWRRTVGGNGVPSWAIEKETYSTR
jgi:hypothetical protein